MSGKSTYLRQTGLLTVMAMVGCFVPAEYASFRLHDALLTRLSNDDDMEKSLSTFANEMTSSAMIELGPQEHWYSLMNWAEGHLLSRVLV